MGSSYWPRLMFLEQSGPHSHQLRKPFLAHLSLWKGLWIMRTADKADPGPDMTTVIIHIWPLCLVSGLKRVFLVFFMGTKMLVLFMSCIYRAVFMIMCWSPLYTRSFLKYSVLSDSGDHPGQPGSPGLPRWADRRLHLLHPRVQFPLRAQERNCEKHDSCTWTWDLPVIIFSDFALWCVSNQCPSFQNRQTERVQEQLCHRERNVGRK